MIGCNTFKTFNRRDFLRIGGATLCGVNLLDILASQARPSERTPLLGQRIEIEHLPHAPEALDAVVVDDGDGGPALFRFHQGDGRIDDDPGLFQGEGDRNIYARASRKYITGHLGFFLGKSR